MKAFFRKHQAILETVFLLTLLAGGCLWRYQEWRLQQEIAGKILRFHVRANSDNSADQALKLKVRDAVGALMQQALAGVDDREECCRIVRENLTDIIHTAEQAVQREGYAYPVTAQIETVEFPQKTYGNFTFPAGDYQALDVVIGSGEGQNWWCVMYPNMCFHGAVYEVVDEEAKQSLRKALSQDEYSAILQSGQYRIRFKYLKFLNKFLK